MDSWLALLRAGVAPELIWGLVPRVVGALYAIAFASLLPQILGLVGSRGISPVREQLAAMREHFPDWRRFMRLPTLLWLSPSDRALRLLPWLGIGSGLFAIHGGPGSWWALLACFACYLSLDVAALMFPWDCMLLEAGFLALFLPESAALPVLETATLPSPLAAFALRFLLIRLMWGFAKLKFLKTRRGDDLYLRGFLVWMPMSTPLGFRLQHAPGWVLRGAYAFMWFVEVVCPGLLFFRGELRALGALGLISLMGGIWATGNWGFFNLGYAALCVLLFDTQSSLFDLSWAALSATPTSLLLHAVLALHTLAALLCFPHNSWVTHAAWSLSFDQFTYTRPWLRGLFTCMRTLARLRTVHAYGVFPPNSSPPIKIIPVFEGSHDGVHFTAYEYRYMPCMAHSRTPIVAPHHPRLDHLAVYFGSGLSESDYLSSLMGAGKPYGFGSYSHFSWAHRVMQRLLEGEPSVRALFGTDPFAAQPPKFCRVRLNALMPASLTEVARTGQRWCVRDAGVVLPARAHSELVYRAWLPPPELHHPDAVWLRQKSPALRGLLAALAAGVPHAEAVRGASDLSAAEVETFWRDLVPLLAHSRGAFERLAESAQAVHARFGAEALLRLERIAERYVYVLRERLAPHMYGGQEPRLAPRWATNFHFMLQDLLLDGREAYESYLRDPALAVARCEHMTPETILHFAGVVRHELLYFHMRTLRIATRLTNAFEDDIPGLIEYRALLTRQPPVGETWVPECTRSASGVWHCHNFLS